MTQLETPVALIVFNRPDTAKRVFDAVATVQPKRLFLISDGPRPDRAGEADRCAEVRQIVSRIDWPCQVETDFATKNIGCRPRIISGINWVFSQVEEAIILEDDCVPAPSFFPYCAEMLARHRNDTQVAFVSGFNPLEKLFPFEFSYYYSLPTTFSIWGWATWRRAWQAFDEHLQTWPEVRQAGLLNLIFPDKKVVSYWTHVFDEMHAGTGPSAWDYQWIYACWTRNWLNVFPRRNLIHNVGFGIRATHTKNIDPAITIESASVTFPLRHPAAITAWPAHTMASQKYLYTPGFFRKVRRKIAQLRRPVR
jgi:hypothetical protein